MLTNGYSLGRERKSDDGASMKSEHVQLPLDENEGGLHTRFQCEGAKDGNKHLIGQDMTWH